MISIIIPRRKRSKYLEECLEHITKLRYADFELLIISDKETGSVPPGKKRNIGAKKASGEILAFIDDDAYPRVDWLSKAMKYFEDPGVHAVCGPGVTPESDPFWAQVSGAVYLSYLSGANPGRFYPTKKKFVDDWPSMNFLIRKKVFLEVDGFDEKYYPGEDTVLCNNLSKAGKKILYCPDVLVYHHRRKNLFQHLKQAVNHKRGLWVRLSLENSLKLKYFLPSLFLLFVLFGWLLLWLPRPFNLIYPALWLVYFLAILIALVQIFLRTKKPGISLACVLYIPLTHLAYGYQFLRGLIWKR